jgi:hypothetical protein
MTTLFALLIFLAQRNPARVMELDLAQGILDFNVIRSLSTAESTKELEARYRRIPIPDSVEKLVFACKRQDLAPGTASDNLLLAALPQTPIEFRVAYMLTYEHTPSDEWIGTIGDGSWCRRAADAILRQKRVTREFLIQGYLAFSFAHLDQYIAFQQSRVCTVLRQQCSSLMVTLPAEVRDNVCIECDLAKDEE